jgi:hypothetical protein
VGIHAEKNIEDLIAALQVRHENLVAVMRGKPSTMMASTGQQTGIYIKAEAIRFAADDVATALKEIRSRLGKV